MLKVDLFEGFTEKDISVIVDLILQENDEEEFSKEGDITKTKVKDTNSSKMVDIG